jgi:hypothetical protein
VTDREKILAEINKLMGDSMVKTKELALGKLMRFVRELPAAASWKPEVIP